MELLLQLIVLGVLVWWLSRTARRMWRKHQAPPPPTGEHDAGVWVNPVRWARIVAELEEEEREGEAQQRDRRRWDDRRRGWFGGP
ncbi:hypothetical protein [Nonomuraea monospora]